MIDIISLLLESAYFLIPAYFANMAPPLAKRFKILEPLAKPIDDGKVLDDNRHVFGQNKTYRGFVVGMIGGAIGGLLQVLLNGVSFFNDISLSGIPYDNAVFMACFGSLMGFGAIFGDLAESFIKRRMGVNPGERFIPWDQTDLVIGAYVVILPIAYTLLSWKLFFGSIIMTFFLHVIANHVAYYLNIRKEKW